MHNFQPASASSPGRTRPLRRWLLAILATTAIGIVEPLGASEAGGDGIAGRVGTEVITIAELERKAGADLQRLRNEQYELLARVLDEAIASRLLSQAAKAAGITTDELVRREIDGKRKPVTDSEVDAFYTANQDQMVESKERVAGEIRQFLADQARQAATRDFLATLEQRYPVTRQLDPPRVAMESSGSAARGPADARVTIVEFSDFECPYCRRMVAPLRDLQAKFPRDVRLVYRHFPLRDAHPNAALAAEATECARDQGRFWEAHDALFAVNGRLQPAAIRKLGQELKLDARRFEQCLDSGRHAGRVRDDLAAAEAAGVNGTPAFFINGRFVSGAVPLDKLVAIVEDELARLPGAPAAEGSAARNQTATDPSLP